MGWSFGPDSLYFFSGFIFIFAALESIILARFDDELCEWSYLAGFFFLQAVRLVWGADSFAFGAENPVHLFQAMVEAISLFSLFCFGLFFLPAFATRRHRIVVPLSALGVPVITTLLIGVDNILIMGDLALGVCGGLLAAIHLPGRRKTTPGDSRWLLTLGIALILYCVIGSIDQANRRFHFMDARIVVQASTLAVSCAVVISVAAHQILVFQKARGGASGVTVRMISGGLYVILPFVLIGGWLLTTSIGQRAEEQQRADSMLQIRSVATAIASVTDQLSSITGILARMPVVLQLPGEASAELHDTAQAILDQTTSIGTPYEFSITDAKGTIIVSSNRSRDDALIGRSIAKEPFFAEAMARGHGRSYLRNENERECSYYDATAIHTSDGGVRGMVVARASVDLLESAFTSVRDCFLVDERGTIYFSGNEKMLFRRLWDPDAGSQPPPAAGSPPMNAVVDGRPPAPPDDGSGPIIGGMPDYGQTLGFFGSPALVTRVSVAPTGWSLVLFSPVYSVSRERLIGIAATLLAVLLMSGFTILAKIGLVSAARVARSESLYRTLIHSSPNWVSIIDPQGIIRFTNAKGPRGFGIDETVTLGRTLHDVFGDEQAYRVAAAIGAAYDASIPSTEITLTAQDGSTTHWYLLAAPLSLGEEGKPATLLIGMDITENREAEQRLLRAERMAAVGTFASGIAHQFNNINAIILGYLELLGMEQRIPADLQQYVTAARFALDHSIEITSRLLILTEPHTGADGGVLGEMVETALDQLRPWLEKETVGLTQDTAESLPVRMSPPHVAFIVRALLSNAVHALGGRSSRSVEIRTGIDGPRTYLRVRDAGIGIAADTLTRVFTPFFTEKGEFAPAGSPQQYVRGVGLSLAVCHSLVSGYGGSIDVESTPGVGSTFTVWLPASPARRSRPSPDPPGAPLP
jgi:PAS domain S-box-containing protein